jgi:hypothetical protein
MRTTTTLVALLVVAAISYAEPRFSWDEVSQRPQQGFGNQQCQQDFQGPAQQQFRGPQRFGNQQRQQNFQGPGQRNQQRNFNAQRPNQQQFRGYREFRGPQQFQNQRFGNGQGFGQGRFNRTENCQNPEGCRCNQNNNFAPQRQGMNQRFGNQRQGYARGNRMDFPQAKGNKFQGKQQGRQFKGENYQERRFAAPNMDDFDYEKSEGRHQYQERNHQNKDFGKNQRRFNNRQDTEKASCQEDKCDKQGRKFRKDNLDNQDNQKFQHPKRGNRKEGNKEQNIDKDSNNRQTPDAKAMKMKLRDAVMNKDYDKAQRILNNLKEIDG